MSTLWPERRHSSVLLAPAIDSMAVPAENQAATLLIVDDDPQTRDRLREIFENADYRVVTATEAPSALRVLKGVRCDLVALDLEMPGVDGLALCKLLRAQPLTGKFPSLPFPKATMKPARFRPSPLVQTIT